MPAAPRKRRSPTAVKHAFEFALRQTGDAGKDSFKIQRMKGPEQQCHAYGEAGVTNARDDKGLLAGVGGGFLLEVKTNEQVGAEPDALPAHKHQRVVRGCDEREHHEEEKIQVGEEAVVAALMLHVPARVKVDQESDHCDGEGHDQGQPVIVKSVFRAQLACLNPGKVWVGEGCWLGYRF